MDENTAVRRVDDLGRVVIPKEMRKRLRIEVDDVLELRVEDGKLIVSKYESEADEE